MTKNLYLIHLSNKVIRYIGGWFSGRGKGWGATLGYCPWTGLPRGARWLNYPYYGTYTPYGYNYPGYWWYYSPWQRFNPETYDEKEALENEYKYL
ncbi:MAG: hypothetical protein QW726_02190, partial [Fervidicoccaceae archaeon]